MPLNFNGRVLLLHMAPQSPLSPDTGSDDAALPPGKKQRLAVSPDLLTALVHLYNREFESYSRGRKKVTQLVPKTVWERPWQNFNPWTASFPMAYHRAE